MANAQIKKAADYLKRLEIDVFNDEYIAVDPDYNSLFLSTKGSNNAGGNNAERLVYEALEITVPLQRAIQHTTAMAGTKNWHEKGLEYSWHYHPEIGLNLSVLAAKA
jgi:hypothetical protein